MQEIIAKFKLTDFYIFREVYSKRVFLSILRFYHFWPLIELNFQVDFES